MVSIKKRASSFPIIVCHPHSFGSHFAFLSLLGSMTEYYNKRLGSMDLKATTVTIQADLNMGWYAHDFLCASQEGMGSDAEGGGGG